MLERVQEQRIRSIQVDDLDNLPSRMAEPPKVEVQKTGLFAKPDPVASGHNRRLQQTANQVRESMYIETGMVVLGLYAQEIIPASVQRMEEREEQFSRGSLARQAAEKITDLHAQQSLLSHTAITKAYVEGSVQRLVRSSRE